MPDGKPCLSISRAAACGSLVGRLTSASATCHPAWRRGGRHPPQQSATAGIQLQGQFDSLWWTWKSIHYSPGCWSIDAQRVVPLTADRLRGARRRNGHGGHLHTCWCGCPASPLSPEHWPYGSVDGLDTQQYIADGSGCLFACAEIRRLRQLTASHQTGITSGRAGVPRQNSD